MKGIKVQYTIKESYVNENKEKINAVMEELKSVDSTGVKYFANVLEDGKSFMHIVVYADGADSDLPSRLDSFQAFQAGLKANIEVAPTFEKFEVTGSSFDFF